jgi:hypothetical protein
MSADSEAILAFIACALFVVLFVVWLLHLSRKSIDRQDERNRQMQARWELLNKPEEPEEGTPPP